MSEEVLGQMQIQTTLDDSDLKRGLSSMKRDMKLANNQMKRNLSSFDHSDRSAQKLGTQLDSLSTKQVAQEKVVLSSRQRYEELAEEKGANSAAAENAAVALAKEEAALGNTNRQIADVSAELRELERQQEAANSGWGRLGTNLQSLGSNMTSLGQGMQGLGKQMSMYITAPLAGIGAAAFAAADDMDQALNNIRVGTGATGDDLDNLEEDFRSVFRSIPTDSETASQAISGLNTMTGATGETLQGLTTSVLEASRILGEDGTQNADAFGNALRQWGIEAEDGEMHMDKLMKSTQDYGVGLGEQIGHLNTYGSVLQNAGFTMDESADLFGRLEQGGFSVSRVMPGLNQAFRRWSDEGKNSQEEFQNTIDKMKGAEDQTEALSIATEAFGSQGAQRITAAVKQGIIPSMDELGGALEGSGGLIDDLGEETMRFSDRVQMMRNQAQESIEPLGHVIIDVLEDLYPTFERILDVMVDLGESFGNLSPEMQQNIVLFGGLAAALGPVVMVLGTFIASVGQILTALGAASSAIAGIGGLLPVLGTAFTAVTGPIGLTIAAIAAVTAGGVALYRNWESIVSYAGQLGSSIAGVTSTAGSLLTSWEQVGSVFTRTGETIAALSKYFFYVMADGDTLNDWVTHLPDPWQEAVIAIGQVLSNFRTVIVDSMRDAVNGAQNVVTGLGESLTGFLGEGLTSSIGNVMQRFFDQLKFAFTDVGGMISFVTPLITGLGLAFVGATGPIGALVGAVVGLGTTLYRFYNTNEEAREIIDNAWSAIQNTISNAIAALQPIFDVFIDSFNELLNALGPEFQKTFDVMKESIDEMSPVFSELGSTFQELGSTISPIIGDLISIWIEFQTTIWSAVAEIAQEILPLLMDAFQQIFPAILSVVESVLPFIIDLMGTLIDVALEIVQAVLPVLLEVFQQVFPMVLQIVEAALPVVTTIIKVLIGIVLELTKSVLPALLTIVETVFPVVLSIVEAAIPVVETILRALTEVIENALIPAINFILDIVELVFPQIANIIENILNIVIGVINGFIAIFTGNWEGLFESIRSIADSGMEIVRGIFSTVFDLIVLIIQTFYDNAVNIFNSFWDTTKSIFNSIGDFLEDLWNNTTARIEARINELWLNIRMQWQQIENFTVEIYRAIRDFLTDLWDNLVDTIIQFARDLKNDVQTAWNDLFADSRSLFNDMFDWLDQLWSDMWNTITGLADDIADGVTDAWDSLFSSTMSFFNDISDWVSDTFDNIVDWSEDLPDRIGSAIDSMKGHAVDGVESMVNDMADGLENGLNFVIEGLNTVLDFVGVGEVPLVDIPRLAKGTNSHAGGPAVINDGGGPELVKTPGNKPGFVGGENALVNLPKGSKVLPYEKTNDMFGGQIPKYSGGIGSTFKGLWDTGTDAIGSAGHFALDTATDAWDFLADGASGAIDSLFDLADFTMPEGDGFFPSFTRGAIEIVKDGLIGFTDSSTAGGSGFDGANFGPEFTLSSRFNPTRLHPIHGTVRPHNGDDWAAPMGTPVRSQTGGVVTGEGYNSGLGNYIEVKDGGYTYRYGHNSQNNVAVGDAVTPGQTIGLVGSTGNSTGPHIHFEVRRGGAGGTAIDPSSHYVEPTAAAGPTVGGDVSSWVSQGMQAAGVSGSNWQRGLELIAQEESGGNVRAVNNWDINARNGIPSKGLMQTIDPTFSAYSAPGMNDIYDPVHNVAAATNYILSRYGDISNVPGVRNVANGRGYVGYEDGGIVKNEQLAWLREGGYDESIISHDPAKKPRSESIWKQTGEKLGFTDKIQNSEMAKLINLFVSRLQATEENSKGTESKDSKIEKLEQKVDSLTQSLDSTLGNMVAVLEQINNGVHNQPEATFHIGEREIAKAVYEPVTEFQDRKKKRKDKNKE